MLRVLAIGMLMTLAAGAGFYVPRFMQYPSRAVFEAMFPDLDPKYLPTFSPLRSLGCSAITSAGAFEDRRATFVGRPSAIAESGAATDKYSLSMTSDGKGILLLSAFDVALGATDAGEPLQIMSKSSNYIHASRDSVLSVVAVIIDMKTLKAAISFNGQGMLGITGRSILVACH